MQDHIGTFVEDVFNEGGTSMEPLTIVTTAVAFLSPYLLKAGEKVVEEVGKKLAEAAAWVWDAIMTKFRGNAVAEAAVKGLRVLASTKMTSPSISKTTETQDVVTLLGMSKTYGQTVLHTMFEGQRDRIHSSREHLSHSVGD
jgi:hypothetical protein